MFKLKIDRETYKNIKETRKTKSALATADMYEVSLETVRKIKNSNTYKEYRNFGKPLEEVIFTNDWPIRRSPWWKFWAKD